MPTLPEQGATVINPAGHRAVHLLVTGFGRYPGVRLNPTATLMRAIVARINQRHGSVSAVGGELTVSYARARAELVRMTAAHAPDAILLLGLAARARWVRVERFGRRLDSPLHVDSAGRGGGRHAAASDVPLRSTAQIEPALHALLRLGIRARLSPSAGRYLCNAIYATALAGAGTRPVLFVHVPFPRGFKGARPVLRSQPWQPTFISLERALTEIAFGLALQARREHATRGARHGP
jgi:pyroglutamyl-peptidase